MQTFKERLWDEQMELEGDSKACCKKGTSSTSNLASLLCRACIAEALLGMVAQLAAGMLVSQLQTQMVVLWVRYGYGIVSG